MEGRAVGEHARCDGAQRAAEEQPPVTVLFHPHLPHAARAPRHAPRAAAPRAAGTLARRAEGHLAAVGHEGCVRRARPLGVVLLERGAEVDEAGAVIGQRDPLAAGVAAQPALHRGLAVRHEAEGLVLIRARPVEVRAEFPERALQREAVFDREGRDASVRRAMLRDLRLYRPDEELLLRNNLLSLAVHHNPREFDDLLLAFLRHRPAASDLPPPSSAPSEQGGVGPKSRCDAFPMG